MWAEQWNYSLVKKKRLFHSPAINFKRKGLLYLLYKCVQWYDCVPHPPNFRGNDSWRRVSGWKECRYIPKFLLPSNFLQVKVIPEHNVTQVAWTKLLPPPPSPHSKVLAGLWKDLRSYLLYPSIRWLIHSYYYYIHLFRCIIWYSLFSTSHFFIMRLGQWGGNGGRKG